MSLKFVNRQQELDELTKLQKKGGLLAVYGRRRVGKTSLLTYWLKNHDGLYSQAVEGHKGIQISQIFQDLLPYLRSDIVPKTWSELFQLLELEEKEVTLCLDEFPYLVAADPSLPSLLQKWWDHRKKKGLFLILCGSSYHMMHNMFLHRSAPLFGRCQKIIHIQPMGYRYFCNALSLKKFDVASFIKFSLVGGIPKYWEFIEKDSDAVLCADTLYFGFAPYMENEPQRILQDEKVSGIYSISVLEAIGRGATRPSEIAARLGVPQTQIAKVLYRLMDASLIIRDLPFGQSEKNPKNVLYRIGDPSIRFWYTVYSPHRTRWRSYDHRMKQKLLHDFASTVFEDYCRDQHQGAKKYWERNVEFDLVKLENENAEKSKPKLVVAEVKFTKLNQKNKNKTLFGLQQKWFISKLSKKYSNVEFRIIDQQVL